MSLEIAILVSGGALAGTLFALVTAKKRRVTARPSMVLQTRIRVLRQNFTVRQVRCALGCRRSRPTSSCQAYTIPKVVRQPVPHPDWVAEEGVKQPHPYDGQPFTALDPQVR